MKNYVLNGTGNGKKALFYFSLGLYAIALFIFLPIIYFMGSEIPTGIDFSQGGDIFGVVVGYSLIALPMLWIGACINAWFTSLFVTKRLDVAQRKRFAAMYYIIYSIVAMFVIGALSFLIDPNVSNILAFVLYFVFLKVYDKKMI